MDERVSALQDPAKDQALIWRLSCEITESLRGDRRRREEETGADMEALLRSDPPIHREEWNRIKGWYWAAIEPAPPPAWVTLEQITEERVELYSYVPPPGLNTPISVEPFLVDDSVPTEDKIEWAVKLLHNHRPGRPLGMRASN